jgi:hypothetical protein
MTIFDAPPVRPPFKYRLHAIAAVCGILLAIIIIGFLLRFHTERNTIRQVMNAIAVGNFQQGYALWKPTSGYSFDDFMQDWGPDGYYGPVKSYRIDNHLTEKVRGGGSVSITLDLSPYQPFPANDDFVKQNKTKHVRLWVQFKDESISFPPN